MSGMDRDSRLFEVGSRAAPGRGNAEVFACSAASVPVAGRSDRPLLNAALFEEFMRLRQVEHMPLVGAARALGKSPSLFSGRDCLFKRYQRGGLAELAQSRRDGTANGSDLTLRIEGLGWFIPAAQFFYYSTNRRRGALAKAIWRAAALPELPRGWNRDTSTRFLARLNLPALPECPAELRAELAARERAGKPPVPPRIARLLKASPSSARRHCFETRVEDLAQVPFAAIAKTLSETQPGRVCRLILELL